MNPEPGVQAAPAPPSANRRRRRWWLIAIVVAVSCWAARIAWLRRAEAYAELALNVQRLYVDRDELLPEAVVDWLVEHGVHPPRGHAMRVSDTGAAVESDITDLSMLSAFTELEEFVIDRRVDGAPLTESAQASLARTPPFPRLRTFRTEITLGDDFFQRFSRCPDLEDFDVIDPNLTDEGLRSLAGCAKLEYLIIPQSKVHRGLNSLSLRSLKRLVASKTLIDSIGLEGLRGCTQLEHIELVGTQVDDAGLEILAELPLLKNLFLDRTRVTSAGLEHLLQTSRVHLIGATDTAVTVHDAIELSKSRGKLRIVVGTQKEPVHIELGVIWDIKMNLQIRQ